MKCSLLESLSLYLSNSIYCVMIRYLHIHAYTFEDTGVGRVSRLRIYSHWLYRLLGVGCDVIS